MDQHACTEGTGELCKSCKAESEITYGSNDCKECNPGYHLGRNGCLAYECTTGTGSACASCKPPEQRLATNHCETCNAEYTPATGDYPEGCNSLDPEQQPSVPGADGEVFRVGDRGTDTCPDGMTRVGFDSLSAEAAALDPPIAHDDQVAECAAAAATLNMIYTGTFCGNMKTLGCMADGATMKINVCAGETTDGHVAPICQVVYPCSTGTGAMCATCKDEDDRSSLNHCATCNEGYFPDPVSETGCKAWDCTPAPGPGCATCKAEGDRRAYNHCESCNAGYTLDGTGCAAYIMGSAGEDTCPDGYHRVGRKGDADNSPSANPGADCKNAADGLGKTYGGAYCHHQKSQGCIIVNDLEVRDSTCAGSTTDAANKPVCQQVIPINCEWDDWSEWEECSETCGGGDRKRTRVRKVLGLFGGDECIGPHENTESCNINVCPPGSDASSANS